jgi:hypothetical protein
MDAVVRERLAQVMNDAGHTPQHGLGLLTAQHQGLFYADDGKLATRDPEWLQHSTDVLVGLFLRVGFRTNSTKTKTIFQDTSELSFLPRPTRDASQYRAIPSDNARKTK